MHPIPQTVPALWPPITPGRFAATLRREDPAGCRVALLGLPDDAGIRLNHGRPGAAEGPAAFRAALARYGVAEPAGNPWPIVFDAGDVVPGSTLTETHARVTVAAAAVVAAGLLPVAIGGGHDLTYAFVRAVAARNPRIAGVYFDAHLDVRETEGSGMSFRRLVEDCGVAALHLHGFRPAVNSRTHLEWFHAHGGALHADAEAPAFPAGPPAFFVSFDLDVLDMAYAPGVSAPNPAGWPPERAEHWLQRCGADPRVVCFDLMELSPPHDADGRTARLAAHLFLSFLAGFALRP